MNFRLPFVCAFMLVLTYQNYVTAETPLSDSETLSSGITKFSANLHKTLANNIKTNFISSTIGALTTMSILANGADGKSREELIKAISLPMTQENMKLKYQQLLQHLNKVSGIELRLANGIFAKNQLEINQAFKNMSEAIFQSKVQRVNFDVTDSASDIINNWAKENTANKIDDIVQSDDLINALITIVDVTYFKSNWVHAFSSTSANMNFNLSPYLVTSAPMMCLETDLNHGQILDNTALYVELPCETNDSGNEISVYLVIPNEIEGLDAVTARINEIDFPKLNVSIHGVELCMPKTVVRSKVNLIPALKLLGVNGIFGDDANLSNIAGSNDSKVSMIRQRAIFRVDELGTQVAAAPANVHHSGHHHEAVHAVHHVHHVRCDRPYLMAVVSKTHGIPLAYIQVAHPFD